MKIIIIDDHILLGQALSLSLRITYGDNIATYIPNDFDYTLLHDCDLLLLDFDFGPWGNANDVLRNLDRLKIDHLKIVLFSSLWKTPVLMTCRHPLVRGYVTKECNLSNFVSAINAVMEGGTWYQPEYVEEIKRLIALPKGRALSPREEEVAHLIGQRYSREEIAAKLNISINTVSNHRKSIFNKLNVKSEREI
ncbi:MAG: hypothetical protein CL840_05095 [Crocinitomicaceae bacterium]|nr:hypothetical protein [Crocinitomicaceae bacterium]|tara:strand:- start:405 stop:986 length:582 start_codon:yes stop_codon:yes gene_type:complete